MCGALSVSRPTLVGLSDIPGEAMVKLYCPKCMDVYTPKSSRHHHTDGAYFGTGFPHMLFMVHPEYRPKRPANQFVPRWVWGGGMGWLWGGWGAFGGCDLWDVRFGVGWPQNGHMGHRDGWGPMGSEIWG